jgi:DNA segregation ATPase FtsK/SpoIIIE and related proteins
VPGTAKTSGYFLFARLEHDSELEEIDLTLPEPQQKAVGRNVAKIDLPNEHQVSKTASDDKENKEREEINKVLQTETFLPTAKHTDNDRASKDQATDTGLYPNEDAADESEEQKNNLNSAAGSQLVEHAEVMVRPQALSTDVSPVATNNSMDDDLQESQNPAGRTEAQEIGLAEENNTDLVTINDDSDSVQESKETQKTVNKAQPKERALSRSFADILNLEQNEQRDLSLFKEREKGQTGQKDESEKDINYQFPDTALLPEPVIEDDPQMDEWVLQEADVLNETLQAFHVDGTVKDWTIGPTVTQFEITLGRGVKVNKVTNLTDDLKLALAAKDIRIEAPIPGKSSIGIEIPNKKSRPVMLREVLQSQAFQTARSPLTVALGVDLFGKPQVTNLKKMPHGLIAGATGSGKSVFINSLLVSLLYKAKPSEVKLLLIDPKAVEMAPYQNIPHLLAPVVSDPKSAAAALKWVVKEMDERYERLAASGARNIDSFNEKAVAAGDYGLKMPYIVIVIDELADLMMVAASEVQDYIARITAKARAAGIHLLIATQRPSVDVVTGTIKNNIPTRVAFMVASQVDSRTILDSAGAERLLGKGDMLYLGNGAGQPIRLQGTFIDEEVDRITDFVRKQGQPNFAFDPDGLKEEAIQSENEDELMPQVLDYIVNEEAVSTSKLQRVFSIGYNRAASIVEELEAKRYISEAKGSKPRDVFLTPEGLVKLRES